MFSEFAYSGAMQFILMLFSFVYCFALMYFIAKLILRIYGEVASFQQKALFAFLTGTVLLSVLVYAVYFIGGMASFGRITYILMLAPNPICALLYCYLGIKILKLSPVRAIEMMGNVYLYFSCVHSVTMLIGTIFFVQPDPQRFNYLLDATMYACNLIVFLIIYRLTWKVIDRKPDLIISKTDRFANPGKDLIFFILKALFIYCVQVITPLAIPSIVVADTVIVIVLFLFLATTLLLSMYRHTKADVRNKDAHINALIKGSDEFRSVKHDFYNILQTYNGYFAIEDYQSCKKYHESLVHITTQTGESLDLIRRMNENPSLISLLLDKRSIAEQMDIQMSLSVACPLFNLPIKEVDICRVIACLLDNAIEAANETVQRRISLIATLQKGNSTLIIITNSSPELPDDAQLFRAGTSSKKGHQGVGLNNVRRIIERYTNSAFKIHYYNSEVIAYVELGQK